MKFTDVQKTAAQVAAVAIVGAAVVLTYAGTAQFCHAHGAPGWRGYTIAAMNDVAVLVGIVWPERALQALAVGCALFTGWANFAHAEPGWAGGTVALMPPVLAFLMIAALESVVRSTRTPDIGQATPDIRPDTQGDTGADIAPDMTRTSHQTPEETFEGTSGGQDTGHGPDIQEDTGPDMGPDIVSAPGPDKPQATPRKAPDIRGDIVVPFTGQRARIIAAVLDGRMTQKDAAAKLGCSTKTVSRYVAAAKPVRDEATG